MTSPHSTAVRNDVVTPLGLRTRVATGLGAIVGELSRRVGAGSGTVIGGRVSLALDPDALRALARGRAVALVSGTNGKTTTTRFLAAALATAGRAATNIGGANLPSGLVAALSGSPASATAALEVDESWLGSVVTAVRPRAVVLLNLSRDQLDRVNEVRMTGRRWRTAVTSLEGATVVANADDPIVVWAAQAADAAGAGVAVRWVAAGQPWRADAAGCPACEKRIRFEGDAWSCACGLARPAPHVWIDDSAMAFTDGRRIPVTIGLPGRFNVANAVMAAVTAAAMGVPEELALAAMGDTSDVAGRYDVAEVAGAQVRLLLAKNPAGWAAIIDLLEPAPAPVVVAINARVADGRDPSWLWDVPFERLRGRRVVAAGERAADLAVRLRYAEVDHVRVPGLVDAVAAGAAGLGASRVDFVGNYTAFQSLRRALRHVR